MIFDVTEISKVLFLDSYEEYLSVISSESFDYVSHTLFLVKIPGDSLSVFYGKRRLSDIIPIRGIPESPDRPVDKLYLDVVQRCFEDSRSLPFIRSFYYKYLYGPRKPAVSSIKDVYIKCISKDFFVLFSNEDVAKFIVCTDGSLSEEDLKVFTDALRDYFDDIIKTSGTVWETW